MRTGVNGPMDVDKMQKKLAIWADRDPDHRFYDLYNLLYDEDWLYRAYRAVKSNSGSKTAGIDGLPMSDFEKSLQGNLERLARSLKGETYDPKPVRRTYIPKGDGRKRPLGVPTVRDRIVQEALRMVLEPIYEADFSQYSFGFRPGRSTMDVFQVVKMATAEKHKYFWVIDADIEGFFDNVDHQTLEQIMQSRIKDQQIRDLVWDFLRAGVMEEGTFRHSMLGTPQGGIVSPLLANIYLNELDQWARQFTDRSTSERAKYRRNGEGNWIYVRYADDFLLFSNGKKPEVERMEGRLRNYLDQRLSLQLSPRKTEIVHVNDGFDFLGFHAERRKSGSGGKRTQITIPKEAIEDLKEKVQAATSYSHHEEAIRAKILALNAMIRGWGNYYRHCWKAASRFNDLDYFIWWELWSWIAAKHDLSIKQAVSQFGDEDGLPAAGDLSLVQLRSLGTEKYTGKYLKGNPYLEDLPVKREELPDDNPWLGVEEGKAGFMDQREKALRRDEWKCQECGADLGLENAEVHHLRPVRDTSSSEELNRLENLTSLCSSCHEEQTEHNEWQRQEP